MSLQNKITITEFINKCFATVWNSNYRNVERLQEIEYKILQHDVTQKDNIKVFDRELMALYLNSGYGNFR
ncbi:hypothetical protein T06_7635 [Trichinella sp. T6]|nr:hypothetical protein T06_7635 [Trichinella sp. T6]